MELFEAFPRVASICRRLPNRRKAEKLTLVSVSSSLPTGTPLRVRLSVVELLPWLSCASSCPYKSSGHVGARQVIVKPLGLSTFSTLPRMLPPNRLTSAPTSGAICAGLRDHIGIFCGLVKKSKRSSAEHWNSPVARTVAVFCAAGFAGAVADLTAALVVEEEVAVEGADADAGVEDDTGVLAPESVGVESSRRSLP